MNFWKEAYNEVRPFTYTQKKTQKIATKLTKIELKPTYTFLIIRALWYTITMWAKQTCTKLFLNQWLEPWVNS